jgi:hypothetical protein
MIVPSMYPLAGDWALSFKNCCQGVKRLVNDHKWGTLASLSEWNRDEELEGARLG